MGSTPRFSHPLGPQDARRFVFLQVRSPHPTHDSDVARADFENFRVQIVFFKALQVILMRTEV